MQIIISHVNTDFDALASMIAAKKIYPDAQLVISDKLENRVQRFLNIYRDLFDFVPSAHVDWDQVTDMIIVDVASLARIGKLPTDFDPQKRNIVVYDHHPKDEKDVLYDEGIVEQTGAAVTLLLEEIQKRKLPISKFEASLFGLGLYTDTGNFTYNNTTARDLKAATYLLEQGMNLEMVQRFSEQTLKPEQQEMLNHLLANTVIHEVDGLEIAVSTYELEKFQNGLAMVTNKLLGVKGTDAAISVVKMKNTVCVVGRANSERITLLPILQKLGGGGHKHAGSATVKKGDKEAILHKLINDLELMLQPAITAKELMTHPVKTLTPDTTIEEAGRLMYRYGHSGYPIVEDGRLIGLITRRDLDKGNHHGLGHAPVKAYMTTKVITIGPDATLEEIQELVIEHNIGRLPVIVDGKIVGIVTRTNIIKVLHNDVLADKNSQEGLTANELIEKMEEQLPEEVYTLLKEIGEVASELNTPVYLIGGIVRDMLLNRPNHDIDIVAEGDGIELARGLQNAYGGDVLEHESFRTATWVHPSDLSIDITSSRLEYYERPAALPQVETSVLGDDLQRRDFTINAMAIRLNEESFGELIDPFGGQHDLQERKITILHNISFIEDPTRIFRAVRFEGRFGFSMDEQTEKLALESIDKVKQLTPHRINEEMKRLFSEGKPQDVIHRLFDLQVWQQLGIDEKQLEPSIAAAETLQKIHYELAQNDSNLPMDDWPDWFDYFLLPFYCNSSLHAAERFALKKKELKLLEEIMDVSGNKQCEESMTPGDYHLFLSGHSDEAILFILAADQISHRQSVIDYLHHRRNLTKYITGSDLVKAGLQPSPFFSEILLRVEVSQLNGDISSKEEAEKWLEEYLCTL
ncbi:CBS domain-containing protein [Sporosarcina obsidiansis]|uniref:CBS domain-containing protein n=1 Tax=Sporosarcina obsidiansis TaxID=2660748 RepID=UPI00129BA86B|nr:CBS domain-containing protein [Sporosarcina obsidiansis]